MDEKTNGFSAVDKFFLVLTASGFLGGITFTCLLPIFPFAILPSILFGSGISSMVYRFMGGIKPDDSISIGNVAKLSGTLGSLIARIFVLNSMFKEQVPAWALSLNPQSNIIVLKENGEPTRLDVVAKTLEKRFPLTTISTPNKDLFDSFQLNCWQGKGICKGEPKLALIKVDGSIPQGKAKLCLTNGNLLGLPLLLTYTDPAITDAESSAVRVNITGLEPCKDGSNQQIKVMISQEDAENLLRGKPIVEGKTIVKGEASVAPLQNYPVDPSDDKALIARQN